MEHISTYFKIENDVLYIKGQRDALLKTEEKIREAEEKIRKEQQKRYEAEQQTKQNQYDVVTNLILSTNLPNETIANIANVTLSFVEDLRKTLTQK
jgi:hypothetical protein